MTQQLRRRRTPDKSWATVNASYSMSIYPAKADLLSIMTGIYGNVLCPPRV